MYVALSERFYLKVTSLRTQFFISNGDICQEKGVLHCVYLAISGQKKVNACNDDLNKIIYLPLSPSKSVGGCGFGTALDRYLWLLPPD